MKKRLPLIFLAITTALFTLTLARSAQAQTSDVEYSRYDVEITLNEDGTLSVREIQHVSFRDSFRFAFADIPLGLVGNIENIRVSGGDTLETVSPYAPGSGPFTYSVDRGSDSVYVEWEFFATDSSDDKVFIVEYDVIDGLWVYSDINRIEWRAIAEDREGVNVRAGMVTVNLPFTLADDALDAMAFGPAYTLDVQETKYGEQIVFEATEDVKDGTPFQIVVDFPPGLVPAELQAWQIAEDTADLAYTINRIDVEMVVQEDGRLLITEQQQIGVDAGVMYTGFRELNRLFTDDITIEQISEGDQTFALTEDGLETCVYCYRAEETNRSSSWVQYSETLDQVDIRDRWAGETAVEWRFPELVRGESTTFTLVYLVDGVMRLNEDGTQEIAWTVVPGYDVPVSEAQVTVQLPGRMGLEDVMIDGGVVSQDASGKIVIVPETAVSTDEAWQISIILPEGATTAAKPDWQHELEAEFAAAAAFREKQARIDLAWVVGKIGAGVTAVLAAIVGWYLWGSRKVREMMGNYCTTPPSDLPPGLVAYLIDKTPTAKGALASLLHLAALGLVRVNMDGDLAIERLVDQKVGAGSTVTMPDGQTAKVPLHAARLFNALEIVLPLGEAVSLEQIAPTFKRALPDLYAAMGEEMVRHYYGSGDGDWRAALHKVVPFIWFVGTAIFMFSFVSGGISPGRNPAVLFLGMGGGFAMMVFFMRRFERPRASLSQLGKREAAKWLGFKAYLQEIQRFGSMVEAQEIMERYFAYAVALGVDDALLAQAQAMGVTLPRWIGNGRFPDGTTRQNEPVFTQRGRNGRWRRRWQQGSWLPRSPRPQSTPPLSNEGGGISLQGMSDQLTGSLQSASDRMTTMLNTATGSPQPIDVVIRGAGQSTKLEWDPDTPLDSIMSDIMSKTQSIKPPRPAAGSGSGGYSGRRSSSGGFRRSSGGSRSRSSSRRSSTRRSGGGGRRGFRR